MLTCSKRKFLFKCEDCEMIISAEFDEEKDKDAVEEIMSNIMELECKCGGKSLVLRD